MLLLAGLGNPGKYFKDTRHNIGFTLIDEIHKEFDFPKFEKKFEAFFSKKNILNKNIMLLKPQCFMNLSGNAVRKCQKFFKLTNENVMVFHDDLDMEFLKIKIKTSGGDGGHNGVKSIKENIGNDFIRIKFGIRNSNDISNVNKFVLGKFSTEEKKKISLKKKKIIENIENIFNKEFSKFINNIKTE